MKTIRFSFIGHFYAEIEDNTTSDDIENYLEKYINELEECMDPHAALDEYDWSEVKDLVYKTPSDGMTDEEKI